MGCVMICCPVKGTAVSTGIETDPVSFDRMPSLRVWLACSACGDDHIWSKADAWICDPLPSEVLRAA